MISQDLLNQATHIIKNGGIIAYPTESVFGLGCDPFNEAAVMQLLFLKQRPIEKGLILIASHVQQILPLIQPVHPDDLSKPLKSWPGHHTWVFPKTKLVPQWVSGHHKSIAVRVSKHPVVKQLCDKLGQALISTSANISNQENLNSIKHIKSVFNDKIQLYIDAPIGKEPNASSIRDAHSLQSIR